MKSIKFVVFAIILVSSNLIFVTGCSKNIGGFKNNSHSGPSPEVQAQIKAQREAGMKNMPEKH